MLHTLSDAIGSQVPLYGAGDGAGGGAVPSDIYEAAIVVGNELAGDTDTVCHYLDPGNGTGIEAALAAAQALAPLRVLVYLRRGTYTADPALGTFPLFVPGNVVLGGEDRTTTILVSGSGAGATSQDLLGMDDGAGLQDLTLRFPAPSADATSSLQFVDVRNGCFVRRVNVTVTEHATNPHAALAVFGAYQDEAPSGIVIEDIAGSITRTGATPYMFLVTLEYNESDYLEPAERCVIRNVSWRNSGTDNVGAAVYLNTLAVDIEGVSTVRATAVQCALYTPCDVVAAAPTVRRVHCDARGVTAGTVIPAVIVRPLFGAGTTGQVHGGVISDVVFLADANVASTSHSVHVGATAGGGTQSGLAISGVVASQVTSTAGTIYVTPFGASVVTNITITGCTVGLASIIVDATSGTAVVSNATVVGCAAANVSLIGARTSRSTVVGNRITTAYTDGGTATQAGLNNV